MAPPMALSCSSAVALGVVEGGGVGGSFRIRPCSRTTTTSVTTATVSEMPRTVRQWVRMVATAPSRISPTPSGRSGITPGLAAGGGPPQPPPQPPGGP